MAPCSFCHSVCWFMAALCLHVCAEFSLAVGAWVSHCSGFSGCGGQAPGPVRSVVEAPRL